MDAFPSSQLFRLFITRKCEPLFSARTFSNDRTHEHKRNGQISVVGRGMVGRRMGDCVRMCATKTRPTNTHAKFLCSIRSVINVIKI